MLNFRALLLFLVAISCGAGASVFANRWLQEQAGEVATANEVATIPVIVAAAEIPFGQPIEDIHIKVSQWPEENAPESSFSTTEDVLGRVVNQRILKGEPLLRERVVERVSGSTLSSIIAPNKRAITLRVNDVVGVAGFLLPGNHVDVLGTRMINRRAVSRTVLQNLKVLAVDQKANPEKDEPVVVRAVTLEADLDESLELVKATQEGSIQLVLRNPEDTATRVESVVAKAPPKKPTRRQAAPTVKIIRGTTVNSATIRN